MQEVIIESGRDGARYWKELFRARELLYFFALRDISVRYKEAVLGVAWALFRPLMTMAIFTLIFKNLAGFDSEGVSYPLFALSGMVPWLFFSGCMSEMTTSLLNNPALLTRIYFPRMVIPASQLLVQGVDFVVSFLLLLVLIAGFGSFENSHLLWLPLYMGILGLISLGFGLFLSAVTVKWRDIRFIVPFFVQFGLWLSPVGYGAFMIPEKWLPLYYLNPMAAVIEGFRYSLFGVKAPFLMEGTCIALGIAIVSMGVSLKVFRVTERSFGDNI